MKLKPMRGMLFLKPIDEIKPDKPEVGFGSKTEKLKPEQPYKFEVLAVGAPLPLDGIFIPAEVKPGDIVSLVFGNPTMRERVAEGTGFLVDNELVHGADFRDILGVWTEDYEMVDAVPDISDIPF